MKKFMTLIMAIMVIVPFTNVFAYKTYTAGELVNFYMYDGDKDGSLTTILEDKGADDQFVKVMAIGMVGKDSNPYKGEGEYFPATSVETSGTYAAMLTDLESNKKALDGHAKPIRQPGNLTLISLQELISIFGATSSDGNQTYVIDKDKWSEVFKYVVSSAEYFATSTVTEDGTQLWAIKLTKDISSQTVLGISVEKIPITTGNLGYIPVVYMDKTYDCKAGSVNNEYTCYNCNGDYIWSIVGSQPDTCTVVEDKDSKASCVKPPKTGVEEYIIEFGAVAGICAIVLVMLKKKDLFRQI